MTDFIDGLEADLLAAAERLHGRVLQDQPETLTPPVAPRRRWRWLPSGPLTLAGALVLATGVATAGGTLLVLRSGTIGPPAAVAPEQTPVTTSGRLLNVRVADPDRRQPPWTLRLARGRTGLICATVGQVAGGRFGLVGLDGRFRTLAPQIADTCSAARPNASTLVGVRTLAGRRGAVGPRSVVSGVGGPQLRTVTVTASGRTQPVAVQPGGAFLAVFAALPEDLQLRVELTFADGHRERHPFGVAPGVFADPDGGHAWGIQAGTQSGDARTCIRVRPSRQVPNPPVSRAACGTLGRDPRHPRGLYFDVIRMTPGAGRPPDVLHDGFWHHTPARTIVLGAAGEDVRSITVLGAAGQTHTGTRLKPLGAFAEMFGPRVQPRQVAVRVTYHDGRTVTFRGRHGLITTPIPVPLPRKTP